MDFINAALTKLNLVPKSSHRNCFEAPWKVVSEVNDGSVAYYFVRGSGQLTIGSQKPVAIQAGDLAFVPRGDAHVLADTLHSVSRKGRNQAQEPTSRTETADFLQCKMFAQLAGGCPFVAALPQVLLLKAGAHGNNPYLESLLQSMVWESGNQALPASGLVLEHLWELVFILAFRSYLAGCDPGPNGWLAATRDPQLSRVLAVILQEPHAPWTVERLADVASMSRATFIRQFSKVMGQAPMTFLYIHRMEIAASLLQQGERSLANVAEKVGYGSEAAFSTAFRRHYKVSPGAYRAASRKQL